MDRVRRIFDQLLRQAQSRVPGLRVTLRVGKAEQFPDRRNYAMCVQARGGAISVIIAPKMANETNARIRALLQHELAHAVYYAQREYNHTERETDRLAEWLFRSRISYDPRDLVQTLEPGIRPRPKLLG